ncbi:hypothetical protein [Roseiconus lacunae]|uniref:Uncharacterized protein n=1 Tax=Roseiconus lacunae TaxID=2605694 RepID=A0ABT7PHL0_9BACT|nr:hypothetical protein [Roseiconus lacunae]MDM4015818.1 hypothetical protein [Roseiconus lacunae]
MPEPLELLSGDPLGGDAFTSDHAAKKPSTDRFPLASNNRRLAGCLIGIVIAVMLAMGGCCLTGIVIAYQYGQRQHDRHDHVRPAPIDDEDQTTPRDLAGHWIVVVWEGTSPTPDQLVAVDYAKDQVAPKQLAGFRSYDEEQTDADPFIQHALGRGVATPAVFLTHNKRIVDCAPFGGLDDMRRILGDE